MAWGDPAVNAAIDAATDAVERSALDRPQRFGAASRLARRVGARLTRAQHEQQQEAMRAILAALQMLRELPDRSAAEGRAAMALLLDSAASSLHRAGRLLRPDQTADLRGAVEAFLAASPRENGAGGVPAMPAVEEVHTDAGPLLIAAHDSVIRDVLRRTGCWEPAEAALLERLVQPGDAVLDIGAHVGYHTARLSRLVGPAGRVIAVEADPVNGSLLAANLVRNSLDNVLLLRAAAFNRTTLLGFRRDLTNTGDNRVHAGADAPLRVPALRLDEVLPTGMRVAGIKCDIQGADQRAIAGLQGVIAAHRPWIIVEFAPDDIRALGDDPHAVVAGYRALGYAVAVLDDPAVAGDVSAAELVRLAEAAADRYLTLHLQPA